MRNGDRIRQMTDEELAKLFEEREAECCFCVDYVDGACINISCRNGVLDWLNQEVIE